MTVKMKQVGKVKNNCFEVEIEYIHANGCTDFKTFTTQILDTSDTSNLEKFILSFKEASSIISESRDECEAVPDYFEKQLKRTLVNNKYSDIIEVPNSFLYIMVMQDLTDDGEGDYTVYADMSIKKITFIDDNMNIFDISF
ncbi:hypothetical protein ACTOJ1_000922 [Shigella flexneri]